MHSLEKKVVAVTGAGSGIGRALALTLAQRGAVLALADRDAAGLDETVRLAAGIGAISSRHVVDVADEAAVHAWADDVVREHGCVDALVNNAGVALFGTVDQMTSDEIRWLMDVNFWGVVYGVKAFLPLLRARPEACVVNVSSLFGLWGPAGQAAYAASKFAVRGFTESLRAELASTRVRVVTVHPGGVKTAIAKRSRVAAAADPQRAAAMTRAFDERFLTTPPEAVARDVADAMLRGSDRVVTGRDAAFVDVLMRLFPAGAPRWFNRRSRRLR